MNIKWVQVVIVLGFLPTIFSCSEFLDCSACVKHKCTMIETRKTVQCVSNPRVPGVKLKVTSLDRCDLFIERKTLPTVNTTPTSIPMVFSPFKQTTQPNLYFTPSTTPTPSTTTSTSIPLNQHLIMFPLVEKRAIQPQFRFNAIQTTPSTTTTSTIQSTRVQASSPDKSLLNIKALPPAVNYVEFRTSTTTTTAPTTTVKTIPSIQKIVQLPVVSSTRFPLKEISVSTPSTSNAELNVLSLPERTVTSSTPTPLKDNKTTQLILSSSPPPPPPVNSDNSIMISIQKNAFDDSLSSSFKMFKNMRRDYFHKQCTDNINFNIMKRLYRHKHFTITKDQVNLKIEKCVNMMLRNN